MKQGTENSAASTARVLHGLEASRRVGFAKFFGEREKVEALSHDLNVVREDRLLFERAFAFMWGFADGFQHLQPSRGLSRDVLAVLDRFRGVVDVDAAEEGARAARHILDLRAGGKRSTSVRIDHLLAREKRQGRRAGRRDVLAELVRDGHLTDALAVEYAGDNTP